MFQVAVPCLKKLIFDDEVGLNTPLHPALLEMCSAAGEEMLKEDWDGGPVASQWGRLMRNGGWSLKSSSAPGGVTWPSTQVCVRGRVGFCLHGRDPRPCRGLVCLWLWSGVAHPSLWQGLCRVTEHCLFLVRGNS